MLLFYSKANAVVDATRTVWHSSQSLNPWSLRVFPYESDSIRYHTIACEGALVAEVILSVLRVGYVPFWSPVLGVDECVELPLFTISPRTEPRVRQWHGWLA